MPEAHTSNPQEDQASIRWQEATKFTPEYAQLLAAAFEHASGGVVIFRGSDLTYLMANEKYLALMPGKDIVGKPAHEVLEPWPELEPIFLRVLETGEPYHARDLRYSLRSYPSGPLEERFFSWSVTRVRLPDQEGWFLLNTCVETTDRVHAEQALKEREALLSAFFESPGAFRGIVEIAGDHLIFISCNRAMAEWCGSNTEDRKSTRLNSSHT